MHSDPLKPSGQSRSVKPHFVSGTRRICAPRETLERVQPLMRPLGITRVANVTGLDCVGIPVVMVTRPNARSLAVSQGKGLDLDAAMASGLMESIELYHAERMLHPLRLAAWNELRFSLPLVDTDLLPRTANNRFHRERPLLWVESRNLLNGKEVWLPYELVHTNYTLPLPSGSGCFVMSSNGLASGNHPLEAIIHGATECIERDATTLWSFLEERDQDQVKVDLASIDDPSCCSLVKLFDDAGIAVGIWEVTSDVGIACFACTVVEKSFGLFRPLGPVGGFGCHAVREVALARALTEAAQGRLTAIAGSRDDNGRQRLAEHNDPGLAEASRHRVAKRGVRRFQDAPSYVADTLEQELTHICSKLMAAGVEQVLSVDLTKRELQLPVIRIVIPGLETYHHVPSYRPGARAIKVLAARTDRSAR